ncbi:hypothetical protein NX059_012382 [Plenodomus lindquistii]|nr:hypothetical protein NX059_012382 [Plenodomus lindquistii]
MDNISLIVPHWIPLEQQSINLDKRSIIAATFAGFLSFVYLVSFLNEVFFGVKAPIAGKRSKFEPAWLLRMRFIRGSRTILSDGYNKFKNTIFKIRRIGADVVIIPSKYVDEIRTLTGDKTRSVEPFIKDLCGEITNGMCFLNSDLQNRVVQQRLTPILGTLAPVMKTELDYALLKEMPGCREAWTEINMNEVLAAILSRISARVFLGPEECRNEEWLTATAEYTVRVFMTGTILRIFPKPIRPLVAPFLPMYWGLRKNVVTARRVITRIVESRQAAEKESNGDYEKPTDILQGMLDGAAGEEMSLANLSQRMLILSLASIHTTALTMTQTLYDLCEHPEYFEPIREELVRVLREDGGWGKTTLNKLWKLDSLIKESQRFSPIFMLTFQRIFHQSITLSDGTHFPSGTRIAVPTHWMLNDSTYVPGAADPATFDPFRYSRIREDPAHPENAQRHMLAMTDASNMAFGYGRYACPGRFYAVNEMKMIMGHLLLRYDFKFKEGCSRPKNFTFDSDLYPDMSARLLIRERTKIEDGIEKLLGRTVVKD